MTTWTPSPGYDPRSELLPNIFDHYAQFKPDAIYAEYPVNPMTYEEGYRPITYKALANAINGVAGWLTKTLGPGTGETLAYLGPNDLRYPALVLGAVKAGYCMFLTSPRNSTVAHQSLLTKLKCRTLLAPSPRPPFIAVVVEAHPGKVVDVPSVAPIIWTHDSAVKHMHMQRLDIPAGCEGQDSWGFGKRMYLSLPPFHAAGLGHILFITMPVDITLIMPTAAGLPSATGLVAAKKHTPFDWAIIVPSIVLELSQSSDLLEYCGNHLEYMMYCGGDLPQPVGDIVARKLRIVNSYGASELGILNVIHATGKWDPLKDWRYLHFHPQLGVEFRHVSGDKYEAVMVRTPEREGHQFPFSISPDRQQYHTNDLMLRHPDPASSDLWRPSSRLDDVIVFLNGDKTNPVSMEGHILVSHTELTGALVAGAQLFQAALIVELGRSEVGLSTSDRAAAIERLWPSIQQANEECPAHTRIAKRHILFTTPEKPMLRAGKGTVQRAGTLATYAAELNALYADAEKLAQHDAGKIHGPGAVEDVVKVAAFIRAAEVSDTEIWFTLGMDSLQAITMTRVLKQGLNLPTLTPNVIYLHPSITELTQAVQQLDMQSKQSTEVQQHGLLQERGELLELYTSQIEQLSPAAIYSANTTSPAKHTVILTGSTGQLGTYILDALLRDPSVPHVHCLNRGDDAHERQQNRIKEYGLTPQAENEGRLSFWTADLSQDGDLGLEPNVYTQLQQTATLIIHNAWTVNFNLPLATCKPHMQGVVNLINFATRSPQSPHLFFLSSISSVMGHRNSESGLIPETVLSTTTPAPNGYANSEYIAEHLLDYAAKQQEVQQNSPEQARAAPSFSFARVGQVAGAVRSPGLWNRAEWFPSLVQSSRHLQALPDTLGLMDRVDWVPVDLLAEVLVELALVGAADNHGCSSATGSPPAVQVYHPVNLQPQSWDLIRPVVADALFIKNRDSTGKTIETIPLREWVQSVRHDIEAASSRFSADAENENLDFFQDLETEQTQLIVFESLHTAKMSKKLHEVEGVRPEWLRKWIAEWLA
ncbi:acetyl-CoA synthetase-like protein [Aspergillus vadensis CBS 113365]|uniref:Acetyl-CoA synthetase-like protein n=1 Tax=Aspergillus vadensis (strain CBS 113365 / IMI 142717 / IBT 24658) TaxID=1448311 RepID=A0A319AZM8_ASPVC|nr:acetyl-CoA synthetase-like protein [Aspergillus vadensis CBS 113365]PYH65836.1 acetyl-CoA synthetase-like protein [Aspergillus vadensis CBS 113365]